MIKYIGSKRRLLPLIVSTVSALPGVQRVADLFSGTARVGHALKRAGLQVWSNDHNRYAATLARCYVQADAELGPTLQPIVAELNQLPGRAGFFTHTYCEKSRFFQPHNGERVDAIRERIGELGLGPEAEAVLLVSLMEAADRVDNTVGLQMAFLKEWAPRSFAQLELRLPELLPRAAAGKGQASELDAHDALHTLAELDLDVLYLDPPYNHHKYLSNYHIWETLVRWDRPETYGLAQKRADCQSRHSAFNRRAEVHAALAQLVAEARARYLVVSFSNEGFVSRPQMEALLLTRGPVTVIAQDQDRYVGARLGVYNPRGEKVGVPGHLRNTEYLYVVGPTCAGR